MTCCVCGKVPATYRDWYCGPECAEFDRGEK